MIDLYLTKPLAVELKADLGDKPTAKAPFFVWLGHLSDVGDKKFAIFINQVSTFTVLVRIEPNTDILRAFKDQVAYNLRNLHLKPEAAKEFLDNFDQVSFHTLKDKRLLAQVNTVTAKAKASLQEIGNTTLPIRLAEVQVNSATVGKKSKICGCPTCKFQEAFGINNFEVFEDIAEKDIL